VLNALKLARRFESSILRPFYQRIFDVYDKHDDTVTSYKRISEKVPLTDGLVFRTGRGGNMSIFSSGQPNRENWISPDDFDTGGENYWPTMAVQSSKLTFRHLRTI